MDDPDAQKIRILFADADAAFCVFARYSLEQLGFRVTLANDGADVVARFLPDLFDVVLVGLTTPFFDGMQVLHAIKQRCPTVPVILLCDAGRSDLSEKGMKEGAFAYFEKPLNDFTGLGNAVTRAYEMQTVPQAAESPAALIPPRASEADALVVSFCHQLIEATRTQPLSITLQMLATASARLLQAQYGFVLLTHAAGFHLFSAYGFENLENAARDLAAHVGDPFITRVIADRKTIIVPTQSEQPESALHHAIGVPLLAEDQTLGALIIYPLARATVNAACLTQIETLAAQGALAIEFARLHEENARLATIDPTTGVLKREPFLELADREFRRSWRYNQPITAIIVDIDNLSAINLQSGHTFGDQVLRAVANACVNVVRSIDLIGRYDGDAFALLLLMTGGEDAKRVAERLRVGINAIQLVSAQGPVQITIGSGVCSYPRNSCTSIFDLLAVTQDAQRAARQRGVNQITFG